MNLGNCCNRNFLIKFALFFDLFGKKGILPVSFLYFAFTKVTFSEINYKVIVLEFFQ